MMGLCNQGDTLSSTRNARTSGHLQPRDRGGISGLKSY